MDDRDSLAEQFEAHRGHLRSVAYRMLGSVTEADDAIQESWLRLSRSDPSGIENLRGWLTTVIGRVCIGMLRSRAGRREDPLHTHVPDPIVRAVDSGDPEDEALVVDSVGLALLVVLDVLSPAERVAFVLHDMFGVPFDDIAPIVGRSHAAARQLASRARRRVRTAPVPDADLSRQRKAVDAFFAAAHDGDFDALVAVLDPDVVLRSDGGVVRAANSVLLRGSENVAGRALKFAALSPFVRPALVNGAAGVVIAPRGRLFSVLAFTVCDGMIVEINALSDPGRLPAIDLTVFGDQMVTSK
jgi:RNA polymerase sigma-70 factor (ECF subfamily)